MNLRDQMDRGPMSPYQWGVVALCLVLSIMDGFDVLTMAFTANGVTKEWDLTGSQLGVLLSAGLVGMAIGSLFIAPWADRVGRRPIVLGCLVLVTIAMTTSAVSDAPWQLAALRVLTGMGMGGLIVSITVISGEFSSNRWRGLAVALNTTGYAFGATLGGVITAVLQDGYGWRAVFVFGGLLSAAGLLGALVWFPESVDFLSTAAKSGAEGRLAELTRRMRLDPEQVKPLAVRRSTPNLISGIRSLATRQYRRSAAVMCATFFLTMFGVFFVQSWTPRLMVLAGMSESQANLSGSLLNFGGMLGSVAIGVLAARVRLTRLLITFEVSAAILLCAFAATTSYLGVSLGIAVLIGAVINGAMAGLYALSTFLFGPEVRATALGTAMTVGRIGAICSPLVTGSLVDLSWNTTSLYVVMSITFVVAAGVMCAARQSHEDREPEVTGVPGAESLTTP
ncbi:MFS transporter [Streptomyces sp. NPDC056390]|uniref:MFS transporter n=1 Tax=Streptomyces sp. NPDC056390 TaxID=3345806 RepID=UPI0035DD13E0